MINISEFVSSLSYLKKLRNNINADRFKYVCAAEGINEVKAMKMYEHFIHLVNDGIVPYPGNKEPEPEYLQSIIDFAERASAEYASCRGLSADLTNFNYGYWSDRFGYALYIFTKGTETKVEELSIASPDTYISVALMIRGGWKLKHVIRQCDEISNTQRCLDFTEEERRQAKTLRVFDGDVFEVVPTGAICGHAYNCGVYLCHNGAYRKLIYIPGKGYVNNGKPLMDSEECEINIDQEGLFNHHKITWDGFRKLGNIHIDIGCLIEKHNED